MDPGGDFVEAVRAMRTVTCFDVAAVTIFIYDYILSLPLEVEVVWRGRFGFLTALYLIQRYLPFLDTVCLVLYRETARDLENTRCKELFITSGCFIVIGMSCSEMILTARAWGVRAQIYGRWTTLLAVLFALVWIPDFVYLGIFLKSLEFNHPVDRSFTGCLVVHENHILVLCWTVVLVWDAFILAIMVVPAVKEYSMKSKMHKRVLEVVFRDGALYYLILFSVSTVNIAIVSTLPPQYSQLLTGMGRCFHSILTSRVFLHIRATLKEANRQDQTNIPLIALSVPGILGNPDQGSCSTLSLS